MRVVVTSQGGEATSLVDARFGRAAYFVIADTESGEFSALSNTVNVNAMQGAGIQAGKTVVESGVTAVLTGHVGPKAFATLNAAGVEVYTGASGTVADAVEQFEGGQLRRAESADVEGHWT